MHVVRRQPLRREPAHPRELAGRHRLGGMPERHRPPRLDLDDDELVPVERDEVELTVAGPPVAVQHVPSAVPDVRVRHVLAVPPHCVLRAHRTTSAHDDASARHGAGHARTEPVDTHHPRAVGGRAASAGQRAKPALPPRSSSALASSSTLTSLNVTTRTDFTNRAERYTSHTQASARVSSK